MNEVEEYLPKFNGQERDVMLFRYDLFTNKYLLSPKIKFGVLFFFCKSGFVITVH